MLTSFFALARFGGAATQRTIRHAPGSDSSFMNKHDTTILYVEACMAYLYSIRNSKSKTCLLVASCTFYSVITGKSATGSILRMLDQLSEDLKGDLPFFQSSSSWIEICDSLYSNMHRVKKSALGNKIVSVFNHVLAHAFYTRMGLEIDAKMFSRFEEKKMRPTVWECTTFADAVLGLFLFLAKAGRQAMMSGSIEAFFVDDTVVAKWLDEAASLRKDAEFLSNPTAIGTTVPLYLSRVDSAIETGQQLAKVFKTGQQHTIIHSVLLELQLVKKRHICSLTAASFRRAPVGVFLYGTAGVAKSFLAAGLFNHYCAVRGVAKENAYCWTRDDNDDYYSGYKSHYVGVLYDDAAKFRANKVQGVDPSIKDIISAINNIPFITNQAELADKGKVPFLSEWVGVTSNLDDLNADQYYNSSAAFLRRLQVRITPIVKEAYRSAGEDRIDARLIPEGEQYPDLWEFEVAVPKITGLKGEFVKKHHFQHYSELLKFMTTVYEAHIATQDKLMATTAKIGPEPLCACKLPVSICQCEKPLGPILTVGDLEIPVVSQAGTELFGTAFTPPQRSRKTHEQIEAMYQLRRYLEANYCVTSADRLYFHQLWLEPEIQDLCDSSIRPCEDYLPVVAALKEQLIESMTEFGSMSPREQLDEITEDTFGWVSADDGDKFLNFTPREGKKCFFMQGQLTNIKQTIMTFVPDTFTDAEYVLLDNYICEKAPDYIARGWPTSDIIRGALCYVKFYGGRIEDPVRLAARDFLLAKEDEPSWFQKVGIRVACAYFEHKWFHNTCNYVASFRAVQYCVKKTAASMRRKHIKSTIIRAAVSYDNSLGREHPFVLVILGFCTSAIIITLVYKLMSRFTSTKKIERTLPPQRFCTYTGKPVEECHFCEYTGYHTSAQVNLNAIGKKPVVKEEEKQNVWTVTERNITKFDVDQRCARDGDQAINVLKNNVLYAEFRGIIDGRSGVATNRVVVINSTTLVTNNHAVKPPCVMTVWFGPRTEDGPQPSVKIDITEEMVTRKPERDICIIQTMGLPVLFKDIAKLLPKKTYKSVGSSFYAMKGEDGELSTLPCVGASQGYLTGMQGAPDVCTVAWKVTPSRPTEYGDCGTPLLIQSPLGCVIVGIHCGYSAQDNLAWSVPLFYEDFIHLKRPVRGVVEVEGVLAQVRTVFRDLSPKDKLFTDYHKDGHMMVHGQLKGFRASPKFTGAHTPYASYVLSVGDQFEPKITDRLAAPKSHPWIPAQLVLANYLHPTHSMRESILHACVDAFVEHVSAGLTPSDWEDIHPVPIDVAVNGFPGVPNIDAQKFTTSGGHGFRGPKLQYLSDPEEFEEWSHYRQYDDVVVSRVDKIMSDAMEGIRPHAIYTAHCKDEMLSKAKVAAGKARCIYMCPVDFLNAMRMVTLGLTRVMVRRRDLFGIAVGLNTHSEEWDDLHKLAQEIPGDNWVAGDFKAFESVLCILLSNFASKFFVDICKKSRNYSPEMILALETLLADTVNPTIDFFGTLITLLGGEASGHQMTTFFNCVCNQLLHMYAYVKIHCVGDDYVAFLVTAREFFSKVFRNTLGDDVYLKVHPDRPAYNHTTIQAEFHKIGIEYTMADKLAASVPYIPLEEVSFLKRHFAEHSEFPGMKVATLDRESIYKMLLYTIKSTSVSPEEQQAGAMCSAQAEAFFHDRKFFDQINKLIDNLPKTPELVCRMKENPRPSWGTMIKRFVNASPKLQAKQLVPGDLAETNAPSHSYCYGNSVVLQTSWSVDAWGSTTMECSSEERIYVGVRLSPKRTHKPKRVEKKSLVDNSLLSKQIKKNQNHEHRDMEMTHPAVKTVITKLHNKLASKQKKLRWKSVVAQADVNYDVETIPGKTSGEMQDDVQQTTVFKNEPAGINLQLEQGTQGPRRTMDMTQDLGAYLSRPRKIAGYTWAENVSDGFKVSINPWQLFFASAETQKKLQGFSLLAADLQLKFLINGSPFYYGSMIAAYQPLAGWRSNTSDTSDIQLRLVAVSQQPHIWLENQNMSTAQMRLPFLCPYPYIDISDGSQLTNFGRLELHQYAPLLSANGAGSSSVDIQIYAWAENVHLGGPSNIPVAQSGYRKDKQLSTGLSTVAGFAKSASNVPVIGAYAEGVAKVAGVAANVADFFGFTNEPVTSDVQPVKVLPFQLASCEISEPTTKLSLQPKQSVSLGATQFGGPSNDELSVQSFCGRSSYLCFSDWLTTDTPGENLFVSAVSPSQFRATLTQIAHTPMSYASRMFQWWRGSIRYTFKVVRSPYHRGRLQISWDRAATSIAEGPPIGNPNVFNTIMDLDEDSEASFVVPYNQAFQFLNMRNDIFPGSTDTFSTASSVPDLSFPGINGILSVKVLNRLTAPEASSSARLLVFVSAEPDMQFAGPRDFNNYNGNVFVGLSANTAAVAQSGVIYDDCADAHDFSQSPDNENINKEVFGERLVSFREYLHRSSACITHTFTSTPSASGVGIVKVPFKRLPPPPGVYNNGWTTTTTSSGAGQLAFYSRFHPLLALSACFIGYKGSVNVSVNVDQPIASLAADTLSISRTANGGDNVAAARRPSNTVIGGGASDALQFRAYSGGAEGMALTNTKTNTGISANVPYYLNCGFSLFDAYGEYSNTTNFTTNIDDWWEMNMRYAKVSGTNTLNSAAFTLFYGSGPDFDVVFFINVPILTAVSFTP